MASPKGPVRQFVPGALQDLSCPKVSCDSWRRGGLPGMVAMIISYDIDAHRTMHSRESIAIS